MNRGKKRPPQKESSFLKRTICKTRSLKPDYGPTMTQSLMFIPVIRCEEEDLYFIVVECIEAASCLLLRLPASLGNIFLLLRPGVIPAWRKQRCLQPTTDQPYNDSSTVLRVIPPEGKFFQSSLKLSLHGLTLTWFGWLVAGLLSNSSARLLL